MNKVNKSLRTLPFYIYLEMYALLNNTIHSIPLNAAAACLLFQLHNNWLNFYIALLLLLIKFHATTIFSSFKKA